MMRPPTRTVVLSSVQGSLGELAGKEARRYIRLLRGHTVNLRQFVSDGAAAAVLETEGERPDTDGSDVLVVAVKKDALVHAVISQWDEGQHANVVATLTSDDSHLIRTVLSPGGRAVTACVGGTERAALYVHESFDSHAPFLYPRTGYPVRHLDYYYPSFSIIMTSRSRVTVTCEQQKVRVCACVYLRR